MISIPSYLLITNFRPAALQNLSIGISNLTRVFFMLIEKLLSIKKEVFTMYRKTEHIDYGFDKGKISLSNCFAISGKVHSNLDVNL